MTDEKSPSVTRAGVADADAISALADIDEIDAPGRYQEASDGAAQNRKD